MRIPLIVLGCSLFAGNASALDKQGSAHGGALEGPDKGFEIGGQLLVGAALYNPSYAARPDNTGLAAGRFAPHFDFDLIGHRLSIPLDINIFTDGQANGFEVLVPSELDVITGLTSTWGVAPWAAVEFGARYERDMPVDRGDYTQSYADLRTKLLTSLAATSADARQFLRGTDVSLAGTLGVFAYNPTYAARPDNTGLALFRYGAHGDWNVPAAHLGVVVDTTFFTDREGDALLPTELDLTLGLAFRWSPFEVSVAYERDMPLDRPGLTQQFLFAYVAWSFLLLENPLASPTALENDPEMKSAVALPRTKGE